MLPVQEAMPGAPAASLQLNEEFGSDPKVYEAPSGGTAIDAEGGPTVEQKVALTGVVLRLPVPSPRFSPQHLTAPPLVSAQPLLPEFEIAVSPLARPLTSTGVAMQAPKQMSGSDPPSVPLPS